MLTLITFSEAYSELCQTSKMRNQIQRWLTQGYYFTKSLHPRCLHDSVYTSVSPLM